MCRVSLLVSHEAYFCVSIAVESCHNSRMEPLPLNNDFEPLARPKPGVLIAVEGIDGAGKTTQVEFLERVLIKIGVAFTRSKEPTDGIWGRKVRESAKNGRLPLAEELEAFVEDRKEHLRDKIFPALRAGHVVVLDRYFYSTIAYQGSRGGDLDAIAKQMREFAPEPDVVLLLDVPAGVGISRVADSRGDTPNAFEQKGALEAARRAFLDLAATSKNVAKIDASPDVKTVSRRVFDVLFDGVMKEKYCAKPWGCDELICGYRFNRECSFVEFRALAYKLLK